MAEPSSAPAEGTHEYEPPVAFRFALGFEPGRGIGDVAFQEAGGIGAEMSLETFREGGENRFVHQLPGTLKQPRLTLKRGVAPIDSGLVKWCKDVLEGGLGMRIKPQQVELRLLDREAGVLCSWSFANAYPVKWAVAEFRSNKNEVALETVELAYSTAVRTK